MQSILNSFLWFIVVETQKMWIGSTAKDHYQKIPNGETLIDKLAYRFFLLRLSSPLTNAETDDVNARKIMQKVMRADSNDFQGEFAS